MPHSEHDTNNGFTEIWRHTNYDEMFCMHVDQWFSVLEFFVNLLNEYEWILLIENKNRIIGKMFWFIEQRNKNKTKTEQALQSCFVSVCDKHINNQFCTFQNSCTLHEFRVYMNETA